MPGRTTDIGRRIELVPMDPHCHNLTIALYQQPGPRYLVHSYSGHPEAADRIRFVTRAMQALGGMRLDGSMLVFPCGEGHLLASRRVFLEACKLPSTANPEARPLTIADKKSGRAITTTSLGAGLYQVDAEGEAARAEAVAGGLRKLSGMPAVDGRPDRAAFSCGQPHDALVGLLLTRALNVRAVLREEEMTATRGVLAAPSAQK
ncbi:MAG: hypothetical protein HYR60_32475 [Acidobacteria bacterium]|nr:hypothetical protein [Acidobacteriota bacterium]